jgi:hypothetical protein
MKVRLLREDDREWLDSAVSRDFYHASAGITGEFWLDGVKRNQSTVYEDEQGPVVVLKATPILHIDLQLSESRRRNVLALEEGIPPFMMLAKSQKYLGITSSTNSPSVKRYLTERFKFSTAEECRFMFSRD